MRRNATRKGPVSATLVLTGALAALVWAQFPGLPKLPKLDVPKVLQPLDVKLESLLTEAAVLRTDFESTFTRVGLAWGRFYTVVPLPGQTFHFTRPLSEVLAMAKEATTDSARAVLDSARKVFVQELVQCQSLCDSLWQGSAFVSALRLSLTSEQTDTLKVHLTQTQAALAAACSVEARADLLSKAIAEELKLLPDKIKQNPLLAPKLITLKDRFVNANTTLIYIDLIAPFYTRLAVGVISKLRDLGIS